MISRSSPWPNAGDRRRGGHGRRVRWDHWRPVTFFMMMSHGYLLLFLIYLIYI
jgi:hypothetical protein